MIFKKIKSRTPSQRNLIKLKNLFLSNTHLLKNKTVGHKTSSGRNNSGKITVAHKGGGHKKNYRYINFNRSYESSGIVMNIEYDPFRTAHIASIYDYLNFEYFYILHPKNLKIGDLVSSGLNTTLNLGNSLSLDKIPAGTFIHSISLNPNQQSKLSRSAGTFSKLIKKDDKYATILLSSKKLKKLLITNTATIGKVGNELKSFTTVGKAGRSRWLNKRPSVRGVAMNPIDHPHGGGEGKTSGGRPSVTPWGKPAKK